MRRIEHPVRAAVGTVVVVAAITASFLAGRLVQSPERDRLAQAQLTIPVTTQVEERVVDTRTAMAGSVVAGRTQALSPHLLPEPAVVTRQAVTAGDVIRPGSLIGAVSGRPVFALPAPLALYRDLRTSDRGDDVRSLQHALQGIGAGVDVTGRVDRKTTAAVTRLFVDNGFPAPTIAAQAAERSSPSDADRGERVPSAAEGTRAVRGDEDADPVIPYGSFIALPVPEAIVTQSLPVGATVTGDAPMATVQISANLVSFRADAVLAAELSAGQEVSVQAQATQLAGTIATIGEFSEASEGKPPGRDVAVTSADPAFADLKAGLSVTVLPHAPQEKSLAVPTVAIRQDTEGHYVLIPGAADTGSQKPPSRRVPVTVGPSGNGWTAISSDVLKPGTEVVVK